MQMNVDGTNVTGTMTLAVTGGWQTWADNTKTGISLTAGQHVIQIQELSGGFNLNKFTLSTISSNETPYGVPGRGIPGTPPAGENTLGGECANYHNQEPADLSGHNTLTGHVANTPSPN